MRQWGRHRDANSFFHPGARPILLDHKNGLVEEQSEKTNSCRNESLMPSFVVVNSECPLLFFRSALQIYKHRDLFHHASSFRSSQ